MKVKALRFRCLPKREGGSRTLAELPYRDVGCGVTKTSVALKCAGIGGWKVRLAHADRFVGPKLSDMTKLFEQFRLIVLWQCMQQGIILDR